MRSFKREVWSFVFVGGCSRWILGNLFSYHDLSICPGMAPLYCCDVPFDFSQATDILLILGKEKNFLNCNKRRKRKKLIKDYLNSLTSYKQERTEVISGSKSDSITFNSL